MEKLQANEFENHANDSVGIQYTFTIHVSSTTIHCGDAVSARQPKWNLSYFTIWVLVGALYMFAVFLVAVSTANLLNSNLPPPERTTAVDVFVCIIDTRIFSASSTAASVDSQLKLLSMMKKMC